MEMRITGVSFSREFPWELENDTGETQQYWLDDADFWGLVESRAVSFRAGMRMVFDVGSVERTGGHDTGFLPIIVKVHRLIMP